MNQGRGDNQCLLSTRVEAGRHDTREVPEGLALARVMGDTPGEGKSRQLPREVPESRFQALEAQ